MEVFLNIHDLVRVRLHGRPAGVRRVVHELGCFVAEGLGGHPPSIDVHIGPFSRPRTEERVNRYVFAEDQQVFVRDSWKITRWEAAIRGLSSDNIGVDFDGSDLFVVASVFNCYLQPMIRLLLLRRGHAMIHACVLSRDGATYIVAGPSKVGKTTTALAWLERYGRWAGDEYAILSPSRALYCPIPPRLHSHSLRSSARLRATLSHREQLQINLLSFIRRTTGLELPWDLPAQRLCCDVPMSAPMPVSVFALMTEAASVTSPQVCAISKQEMIQKLLALNYFENRLFNDVLAYWTFRYPDAWFADYQNILRSTYDEVLGDVPLYALKFPVGCDGATRVKTIGGLGDRSG